MLEIKEVSKSFNNEKVLNKISFSVQEGEIVSILGPSGTGKSTLLRCINGLEKIDSGEIYINGKNLEKKISKQSNLDIGLVFQDYNLFPQYSVLENVTLSLIHVLKMDKIKAVELGKKILKKMSLLNKINFYPYQLSGGEKQRLAIARTLAINPKIICFDEPTSALDLNLVNQVGSIIKDLAKDKKAILIVTHDIKFANEISDKIIMMNR